MERTNSVSHSLALCRGSLLRFALVVGILLVRTACAVQSAPSQAGASPWSARSHITSHHIPARAISILSPQLSIPQLTKASRASPPPSSRRPFSSNARQQVYRLRVCVLSIQSGVVDVDGDLRACPSDLVGIGWALVHATSPTCG
ncbi:hypothetical protein BDN71DRAFT_771102 [Pleurotus eryngii]|uniref:Uncharacterized protein n=1 Tax=Pleurotus eryngii TaxID=5323 RepID=A0A9P5ZGC6_PLEER|nr:hypothetical protein BDN71DRAFT_771102 [Pleurotus eryngii]